MDEREFTRLFKETKKIVLSAVEKNLAARFIYAINDVVQETYIRAFRGLEKKQFGGHSSINTWLYVIARNESLRMNEKLAREEKKFEKSVVEYELRKNQTAELNPDEDIMGLHELIGTLPEKYRSVLELVSLGYSEKKISEQLSIPRGTVKSRASKGRDLLQRLWKGGVSHER